MSIRERVLAGVLIALLVIGVAINIFLAGAWWHDSLMHRPAPTPTHQPIRLEEVISLMEESPAAAGDFFWSKLTLAT